MSSLPPIELPVLFLDAASPVVAVGLQISADPASASWRQTRGEAGVDLFREIENVLRDAPLKVADVRTVVFCEGPGSLLGVRLAAMALRTWDALPRTKPLRFLGFRSLALVAAQLLANGKQPPFHVISDARRSTWNLLTVAADGSFGDIRRWPAGDPLPQSETHATFHPQEFPNWQPFPLGAQAVPYPVANLTELAGRFSLLHSVDLPDAFLTELPDYKTWAPAPASAPAPTLP